MNRVIIQTKQDDATDSSAQGMLITNKLPNNTWWGRSAGLMVANMTHFNYVI